MRLNLSLPSRLTLLFATLPLFSTAHATMVAVTEVMYNPPGAAPEYIELVNLSSNRMDMARWVLSGGVNYTFPGFDAGNPGGHFLKEYERIVLSSGTPEATRAAYPNLPPNARVFGPWTGSLNNAGDSFKVSDAAGAEETSLSYKDGGDWPAAADGAGHSLQIINQDRKVDDWRNWRASKSRGGTPGAVEPALAEEPTPSPEIEIGTEIITVNFNSAAGTGSPAVPAAANPGDARWRFWNGTSAPQTDWRTVADADLPILVVPANAALPGWGPADPLTQGYAPLGLETAAAPFTGIRTTVVQRAGLTTYYYRTSFEWTGPLTGNKFAIDQIIDDGAIFSINGGEIGRIRMPNLSGHTTTADPTAAPDATYEANGTTGTSAVLDGKLVTGTNILAVELKQNAASSSDHVMAARLKITTSGPAGVVINEVKPGSAGNGFVEFYNPTGAAIDLAGYYLTDNMSNLTKFVVPGPLVVPSMGYATIGFSESSLAVTSPVVVVLTQPDGTTRQGALSSNMVADGRSLGRKPAGSANWLLFTSPTPGADNSSLLGGASNPLKLNEAHFALTGEVDWVEVTNESGAALNLDGYFVSSRADLSDKVALTGSLGAGAQGSVVVNFATDGGGDVRLYLSDAANTILGTAELERRPGLPSVQAWPAGSGEWYAAATDTRDAVNAPAVSSDIVISEIMAGPPSRHTQGEFIELTNKGAATVDLTGWRMTRGIDFDFPAGTSIAPGEYIVIAKDPAYMTANYGGSIRVFGPAQGTLGNNQDMLRLEDARGNLADIVDYAEGGNWPAHGGSGSSLELLHPAMDNSKPSSWRASNESAKSSFQTFTYTGTYRELRGAPTVNTAYKELLMNLVSDGHVVLRNVKLTKSSAPAVNLIPNGDATSHGTGTGVNGFLCTGTHSASDTLSDGFHIISNGSGDTKANKVEVDVAGRTTPLLDPINVNDILTLSFEGRWISGLPLLVAQTWDRSFGNVFRLPIPANLGTPGAANSVAVAAAAPTVDSLMHSPAVPSSTQSVVITARVTSADALTNVMLLDRVDTVTGTGVYTQTAMNDAGTGGDVTAGDGIWTVTLAPRGDGVITQYFVRATAANGQINECPRHPLRVPGVNGVTLEEQERPAMYIVDNTPATTVPGISTQRFILSLRARNSMTPATGFSSTFDWDHQRMSNYGWNATIIFNESDVQHNGELRRGGSPWTRSGNNSLERARWKSPSDSLWRNYSKLAIDSDGTTTNAVSRFHNRITRYMLYLQGTPVPDAEFVQQIVNTDAPNFRDCMEMTDSDFFDRSYGEGGELYEIDDAWFMYDTNNHDDRLDAGSVTGRWSLQDWNNVTAASPGPESPIFFHGNWPIRFPEERYDYASLSSFIKTTFTGGGDPVFREQVSRQLDIEKAALYAAVRGYVGDWDNFTINRGKNGYFYRRPSDGKFEFSHWDSDLAFQTTTEAFIGTAGGTGWTNLSNRPWFRQRMYYYLTELLTKYTKDSARMTAWLDAMNYQSGNASALAPFKTSTFSYPTWFTARETPAQNFITSTNYTRPFAITNPSGTTVAAPIFALTGNASSQVAYVDIVGHPEAVFVWGPTGSSTGEWGMTNIALMSGLNSLSVRAIASDGTVLNTLAFDVTLSVNGPPVGVLTSSPASLNVAANETISFDTTGSFDPEGSALTYAWSVTPTTGATLTHPTPAKADLRCVIPGIYTVSVSITDASAAVTTINRDVTVYNSSDFTSFGGELTLNPTFTVQNVENRDNFSPSTWYSVEDINGRLHIQVMDDVARPLASPTFTHPLITRDVPDTTDFVLQTDLEPDTREFGNWQAGLWLEMQEGGATVRYVYAIDGGLNLVVRRSAVPGSWTQVNTTQVSYSGTSLRIRRAGASLAFQRRAGNAWVTTYTHTLASAATGTEGGIFVSTSVATTVRVAFDYLLVADPAAVSPLLTSLRVTEIMYNPAGTGGQEFIELTNAGNAPINLEGAYFAAGNPVDGFTFPAFTLAPGAFVVVTDVTPSALVAAYPRATLGSTFQWPLGALSNGGERITLHDAEGNVIQDFQYDDDALTGWPQLPDGGGKSLESVNLCGDYSTAQNWRSSVETGGTPGWEGAGFDTDSDGLSDRLEILAGTNPADPSSSFAPTAVWGAGGITVTWPAIAGRTYRLETSTDLQPGAWTTLATMSNAAGPTFSHLHTGATTANRVFYRIVITW